MPTPESPLPSVSIVIPTHNRQAVLALSVRAALANPAAAEVIVVVNGSRDGSMEVLETLGRDDRRLVPIAVESAGENAARQKGVEAATAEVVLILDDDVVATPGLAAGHARHHRDESGRVVVGYMPVGAAQLRDQAESRLYGSDYEHLCSQYEADPKTILVDLWGGNISLRRADCLDVGFVRGDFGPSQHTDTDFGIRCRRHGLVGAFDRSLRAQHLYVRTRADFLDKAREQARARTLIDEIHADVVAPWGPESYCLAVPRAFRWALYAGSGRRFRNVELHALEWLERVAHRRGSQWVEDRALYLVRALVQIDTYRDSRRGLVRT